MKSLAILIFVFLFSELSAQQLIEGSIQLDNQPVPMATIAIKELNGMFTSDSLGKFSFQLPEGNYTLKIQSFDSKPLVFQFDTKSYTNPLSIVLERNEKLIEEVVVSGQLREINKLKSIVPVEIYNESFFKRNPTASVFEALQTINGVRPQVNCNICSTGDIHINGLEGPYTMILIDGMPIVSSLATVYGLSGIPNSLVERMEIVRGPSSALYGSEAIGGVINIITKSPVNSSKVSADLQVNTWLETNVDLGFKLNYTKRIQSLTGINYFSYSNPQDNNKDGFTDVTLQNRISFFHKINIERKTKKAFTVAARYLYEDRWGGQMSWNKSFRGGDSIYGESIYTNRFELLGKYELPLKEKIFLTGSFTNHRQNSYYGTTPFFAEQNVAFGQLTWFKDRNRHSAVFGVSARQTNYNDNTPATSNGDSLNLMDQPSKVFLPGIFFQDDWTLNEKHQVLFGLRYDYSSVHKSILTPRIGYKYVISKNQLIRLNSGTGYRVVSIFTEDHAALTGARKTVIEEELKPETSYNINLNYYGTFYFKNGTVLKLDVSPFYTYFGNKIIPDYITDPTKIIYKNVDGYAESKGINLNLEIRTEQWKWMLGGTFLDVSKVEKGIRNRQLLTERFSGTWTVSYEFKKFPLSIDYSGNVYSPMLLPVLGELDPRSTTSPWWSIQNIQFSYAGKKSVEFFGGVKNLLNWVPGKKDPFIIARAHDPFDKLVQFKADGSVQSNSENPYGLTFDPTYVYGPNQGVRLFFGIRYKLK
ncbi:MAG: TonB-dependent receptor [Crocinitomicaceae bacterium]|nr:MAG: TonB-dependent receptor [Crocinitomicaceae bacterium]